MRRFFETKTAHKSDDLVNFEVATLSLSAPRICRELAEQQELRSIIERCVALIAALFLLPTLICIAVVLRLTSGAILYRHPRIGYQGRWFYCLKFQTMVPESDKILLEFLSRDPRAAREWEATRKLKNDPRITRFGRILRITSLDELPQILNIIRGEMSFIGPRPIVEEEAVKYGRQMRFYTRVRPGITGLWQVSGRSETSYNRRIAYDRLYVSRRSLSLDGIILLRTIPAVVGGFGAL